MKGEVIPLTMVAPNREVILVSILGGRVFNNRRLVLGYGMAQKF